MLDGKHSVLGAAPGRIHEGNISYLQLFGERRMPYDARTGSRVTPSSARAWMQACPTRWLNSRRYDLPVARLHFTLAIFADDPLHSLLVSQAESFYKGSRIMSLKERCL
jgi:hypothetical protein